MKQVHDRSLVAFGDHKHLVERHQAFLAELAKHEARMPDYGFIKVSGTAISASCYGVELETVARVVATNEEFFAVEYAFFGHLSGERHFVHTLYLAPNGSLCSDAGLTARICDYNNSYLAEHVVAGLAEAFLKSRLVAPHK